MSETPEEKEAFEKADEAVEEAGWREERKVEPWARLGPLGFGWLWWLRGFRAKDEAKPGSEGLREALHEDDEKS